MPTTQRRYSHPWVTQHLAYPALVQPLLHSVSCQLANGEQIASRRVAIFGHIARLSEEVPAHQALRAHDDLSLGRLPGLDRKRRPGRPNNRWVDQVRNDTGNIPSTLWRSAILRGHGSGVTQRPSLAMRT